MGYESIFEKKRVLITGGLGFIGSNLAHRLVALGADVTIVDSLIPQYGGNIHNIRGVEQRVRVNIADVRDLHSMNALVQNQHYLFNLAGQVSHVLSMKDPFADLEINCRAQLTILEACRQNNPDIRIIYAATRGQYGRAARLPVHETAPLHPVDVNGIHKTAGEMYHILYSSAYGIRATSLRLTNTYGPRHSMKSPDQSFLNWFVRRVLDHKPIQIFGNGLQRRDFNYISDVIDAVLRAAASQESAGEIFNLGSTECFSILETAKLLIDVAGEGSYDFIPYPAEREKLEIGDYQGDFQKIRRVLGWTPVISLRDGLKQTLQFYKENRPFYWDDFE